MCTCACVYVPLTNLPYVGKTESLGCILLLLLRLRLRLLQPPLAAWPLGVRVRRQPIHTHPGVHPALKMDAPYP